jgi:hypothetical protein
MDDISYQGLGENEAETTHRELNRATPGLAALAGADGKSAQKLVQVSARLWLRLGAWVREPCVAWQ